MGYELHIRRPGAAIALDDWLSAVSQLQCVRPHEGSIELVNDRTGEKLSFKSRPGDLDVLTPEGWFAAFSFSHGEASFRGTPEVLSPVHPVHSAAKQLAELLQAEIVGDDGETYSWTE